MKGIIALATSLLLVSPISMAKIQKMSLISKDGTKINAVLATPDNTPVKGAVLIVHGLQSHILWHQQALESWPKKGIVVVAFDRRGSGESEGLRGHFNNPEELQEDTMAAYQLLKKHISKETPKFLFGNSFGFTVSTPFAYKHQNELSGLILSSPATGSTKESDYSSLEKVKIFISPAKKYHDLAFGHDAICSSDEALLWMKNDKLMQNKFTTSFLRNTLFMRANANKLFSKLKIPTLVFLSKKDRIIDNENALKNLETTIHGKSEIHMIDGEHDLTLSHKGEEVTEIMEKWIDSLAK